MKKRIYAVLVLITLSAVGLTVAAAEPNSTVPATNPGFRR